MASLGKVRTAGTCDPVDAFRPVDAAAAPGR
jgi:hypothetical protein